MVSLFWYCARFFTAFY